MLFKVPFIYYCTKMCSISLSVEVLSFDFKIYSGRNKKRYPLRVLISILNKEQNPASQQGYRGFLAK